MTLQRQQAIPASDERYSKTAEGRSYDALTRAFSMRLDLVARLNQADVDPDLPHWRTQLPSSTIQLQEGGTCAVGSVEEGSWGAAVLDRWFRRDIVSCMLKVDESADDLFVGVCSSNFAHDAEGWNSPLSASRHAVCVHAGTGAVYHKGIESMLKLPLPVDQALELRRKRLEQRALAASVRRVVRNGSVVHLVIDMDRHELTIEVLAGEDDLNVLSSVVLDRLPVEVGVVVSFGAGAQRVRLLGMRMEEKSRSHSAPPMKMMADLWDDNHVIKPLRARARRSRELFDLAQHDSDMLNVAREC